MTTGDDLKAEGIARAQKHAHAVWKANYVAALNRLLYSGKSFTSEDAIAIAGMPPGHPSAVGAMISGFCKRHLGDRGDMEIMRRVKSKRLKSHSAWIDVYRLKAATDSQSVFGFATRSREAVPCEEGSTALASQVALAKTTLR